MNTPSFESDFFLSLLLHQYCPSFAAFSLSFRCKFIYTEHSACIDYESPGIINLKCMHYLVRSLALIFFRYSTILHLKCDLFHISRMFISDWVQIKLLFVITADEWPFSLGGEFVSTFPLLLAWSMARDGRAPQRVFFFILLLGSLGQLVGEFSLLPFRAPFDNFYKKLI